MSYDLFSLGDVRLQSGQVLPDAQLAYKTYGTLNAEKSNAILLPTFYTGTHKRNEGFFGADRAINPERHFIVSIMHSIAMIQKSNLKFHLMILESLGQQNYNQIHREE